MGMKNSSIRQIANELGVIFDVDVRVFGYQIDSRLIQSGDLFFALPGETTDGHLFLPEVKKKGGSAAIVSKNYQGEDFGLALLKVPDVVLALQHLARCHLLKTSATVIGITGSVGKTTTKEFIAGLLEGKYRVVKNIGSYNTKLTLPLTILNSDGNEEVFVLEMGMSQMGDIKRLLEIAAPDIAVLTKIALAHAEFFPGGLPEIARGKAEIFSHPKTKTAIFERNFLESEEIAKSNAKKLTFSLNDSFSDLSLSIVEEKMRERGVTFPFKETPILHNFLASVLVAREMQMDWDEIFARIPFLKLPKMRWEKLERRGIFLINDAYNANPESMKAALSNLPSPKQGRKTIAVLGSMEELGSFSESAHRDIGSFAADVVDHLLTLGPETEILCNAFQEKNCLAEFFTDIDALKLRLKALALPGDVVLIKGSRSMQLERVLECF